MVNGCWFALWEIESLVFRHVTKTGTLQGDLLAWLGKRWEGTEDEQNQRPGPGQGLMACAEGVLNLYSFPIWIIGPCYRGVWMCIAGVWDLQTTSFFEIRWFLGFTDDYSYSGKSPLNYSTSGGWDTFCKKALFFWFFWIDRKSASRTIFQYQNGQSLRWERCMRCSEEDHPT